MSTEENSTAPPAAGRPADAPGPLDQTPAAQPLPEKPLEFGVYELLEELGRGGMGIVYKARHKKLDRTVALKMVAPRYHLSSTELARFEREAIAGARVRHPNLVQVYDAGQVYGQSYLAMEYVEGSDLEKVLSSRRFSSEEAARCVATISRAVHEMHTCGILHRDLKPSNILIDRAGRPKVTDFGLAWLLQASERLTATRTIMGTPDFMAPEQANSEIGPLGPWSDVHALGAILYHLLTGAPPFAGPTPLQTVLLVMKSSPRRPRLTNSRVPRSLEAICLKCLEKRPSRRYGSAAALAEDLERHLAGGTVEAAGSGPWVRLRRWAERETHLAVHLVVLLCLAAVHLGIYFFIPRLAEPHDILVASSLFIWAGCSLAMHSMTRGLTISRHLSFIWGAMDVSFLTALLMMVQGLNSLAVLGYPLIIVLSGLWLDPRMIRLTTFLSTLGLVLLVADSHLWHPQRRTAPDNLIIAFVIIIAVGVLMSRQVRRTQVLSAYLDQEPGLGPRGQRPNDAR